VRLLQGIDRLFTAGPLGTVDDAAIAIDDEGRIAWAGPTADAPDAPDVDDVGGGLVTPGLVDAHTHPLYAGDRMAEVAARSAGAGYGEVAAAGGGIGSTVRSTRATSMGELAAGTEARLRRWLASGTTTVEAKSGYHLDRAGELAAVAALAELGTRPDLPDVAVTFLGAHGVPPDGSITRTDYATEVATWCADAAAAGARFCDVFCDEGYFTVDESRGVLRAGIEAGLLLRVHADELAHTGGAQLAAELGAASADHLLRVGDADARALASAGVSAVLCPATALSLGRPPPARLLADAGVTIALGSDHNAGTSGITDMSLVVALAVAALGLSVEEALRAATAGAAASLRLEDRGVVDAGRRADLVLWDASHEGAFAWAWGVRARRVWLAGHEVASA
jgi:imidazolonepropionase